MEDDHESAKSPAAIVLGVDLSRHSIDELKKRITACESEIVRIRAIIEAKERSQADASAFFRS